MTRLILAVPSFWLLLACGDNANDIAQNEPQAGSLEPGTGGSAGSTDDGSGGGSEAGATSLGGRVNVGGSGQGGSGQGGGVGRGGSGQGGNIAQGGTGQGGGVARGGSGQGGSGQGGGVSRGGSGQGGAIAQGGNGTSGDGQGGHVTNGGSGEGGSGQGGDEQGGTAEQGGSSGAAQGGAVSGAAGQGSGGVPSYGGTGSGGRSAGPQTSCGDFVCNGDQACCAEVGECPTCVPAIDGTICEPVCYGAGGAGSVACLTDGTGEYWAFPNLDRSCQTASDCFLAVMAIGYCGNLGVDSFAEGQQAAFVPYAQDCKRMATHFCENVPPPRTASGLELGSVTDARAECVQGSCMANAPRPASRVVSSTGPQ